MGSVLSTHVLLSPVIVVISHFMFVVNGKKSSCVKLAEVLNLPKSCLNDGALDRSRLLVQDAPLVSAEIFDGISIGPPWNTERRWRRLRYVELAWVA